MIQKPRSTGAFVPRSEKPREEVIKSLYPNRDQQTAFVKNLDFNVTEEELVTFFDVRKEGKVESKGDKRSSHRSIQRYRMDFPNGTITRCNHARW